MSTTQTSFTKWIIYSILLVPRVNSDLTFTTRPRDVQMLATEDLHMWCLLDVRTEMSAPVANTLVGRDLDPQKPSSLQLPASGTEDDNLQLESGSDSTKRAAYLDDPISHVASLTISRDGRDIACISVDIFFCSHYI